MSSILKALKKVEEEKAAQRGAVPLASEVTRNRRNRAAVSRWKMPVALVFVAVLAVVVTIAAMGGFSGQTAAVMPGPGPGKAVAAETAAAVPVTVPVASVPVVADVEPPQANLPPKPAATKPVLNQPAKAAAAAAARPTVSDGKPIAAPVKPAATSGKPVATPGKPVAGTGKPAAAAAVIPAAIPPAPVKKATGPFLRTTVGSVSLSQPAVLTRSPAEFSLSGIAWQKESSSRLAVVNGMAVAQGATVDGARVMEILPDRVRLSQDNRTFEILLGKIK